MKWGVLVVIDLLQSIGGFLSILAFASFYAPSMFVFLLLLAFGSAAPLLMTVGAWQFHYTNQPKYLRIATAGTLLFVIYGLFTTFGSVRMWITGSDTNLGLID